MDIQTIDHSGLTPLARNSRQRRLAAPAALLTLLGETFPEVFIREWGAPPKPLALGIHHDLLAIPPEVAPRTISLALQLYFGRCRPLYWKAIVAGQPRYDLWGHPRGAVTAEEEEKAKADYVAWRKARRMKERVQCKRN